MDQTHHAIKQLVAFDIYPEFSELRKARNVFSKLFGLSHLKDEVHHKIITILQEALTNVIKYSGAKKININLSEGPTQFIIDMIDNGRPFSTIESYINPPVTHDLRESGMGLPMIRSLADDYQYHFLPHKGNHFQFTIDKQHASPCIAIIEDSSTLKNLLLAYLSDMYQVSCFSNAAEFINNKANTKFDLIISDITMPGMSGLELKKYLNQIPEYDQTPFLFLTATEDHDTEDAAISLGIADFIQKPISKSKLLHVVKRILNHEMQLRFSIGNCLDQKITSSLIESLPSEFDDYVLSSATRPAGVGGGDLIFHYSNNNVPVIVVADIMGHDTNAKFFAHAYSGYLHGILHATSHHAEVDEYLTTLNHAIHTDSLLSEIIITCIAIALKPNGIIEVANAGHPFPLLFSKHKFNTIYSNNGLLGLSTSNVIKKTILEVAPGDRLYIYTDGLMEFGSSNEEREEYANKIMKTICQSAENPITDSVNMIMQQQDLLVKGVLLDDTSLIIIERTKT